MDESIASMVRSIEREKIERARQMSLHERSRCGLQLFDAACRRTLQGIRFDHPDWTEDQAVEELRRRVDLMNRIDNLPMFEDWDNGSRQ